MGSSFVVNAGNPVKEITTQQVHDIYLGIIVNWKELGGQDAPIVPISITQIHGTFDGFIEHFKLEAKPDGKKIYFKNKGESEFAKTSFQTVDGNKEALAAVLSQPNGIAFASLGAAATLAAKGAPVKLLNLDGVTPTEANVLSGTYLFQRPLFLLTKGAPKGSVENFISFMTGPDGQKIVKDLDFISIEGTK